MDNGSISPSFAAALVLTQGSIEGAKKDRENTFFKDGKGKASKYADLSACWDACREALQANQIAVLQFPVASPAGYVGMRTTLVFGPTGETISEVFNTPLKDANNAQAMGSAITYARRYALCAVIGICPEDDDGNAAAASPKAVQAPVATRAPRSTSAVAAPDTTADKWRTQFKKAEGDLEAMKSTYADLKNSTMEEPGKTALLKEFGDAIKAEKAKGSK